MIISYIHRILWFVGLLLLQVVILNGIHLGGYATPYIYIYFILSLNSATSRNEAMLWGFVLGLCIDIFSNTPGINAAASVALAFVRPYFLRVFITHDNSDITPSIKHLGFSSFAKYVSLSVFAHHLLLFTLIFFSFSSISVLLMHIVSSAFLTICCILATDAIRN
jgi:rod shape-determining protein MreD